MAEHYKTLSAVFPILIDASNENKKVLLMRRANTGYMDGMWDFAGSGHVDEGETASQALVRELKEEIGVDVEAKDVRFAHLTHRLGLSGNRTYYDIYFFVETFSGEPRIAEPEKCTELSWFNLNDLPNDMIPIRRDVLNQCLGGIVYDEIVVE